MKKLTLLVIFVATFKGIAYADAVQSVSDMYGAVNAADQAREYRTRQLNNATNSGTQFDGIIAQLQMQKQLKQQREMLEETRRQNDSWAAIEAQHREEQHQHFCANYPELCK